MARRSQGGFGRRVVTGVVVAVMAVATLMSAADVATLGAKVESEDEGAQATGCTARPRSFVEITDLIDAPAPALETPIWVGPEPRASRETTAEVEALVQAFLDCSAAGEPLRVWSLYSDAYLERLLDRERGYDRTRYAADLVAAPLDLDERPERRVVSRIVCQGEDRASATVVIWYPSLDREKTLAWRFVRVGDDWRIDEIDGEITFAVP